jgi:hypothetical protein
VPRYQIQVDIPAGTTQPNAVTESVTVDERYVEEGVRFAAPGSANTVKARLFDGETQLLPVNDSDPTVIPGNRNTAPIRHTLPSSPSEITVRAFAPDSDFDHTLTVIVDVVEVEKSTPLQRLLNRLTPTDVSDRLSDVDTVDGDSD